MSKRYMYSGEGDLFCGVNTVKNPQNMTDLEKKHLPVIDAPGSAKKGEPFMVTVEVGHHMAHPNTMGHFIQWIELYSGDTLLARAELVPEFSGPKVTFPVMLKHGHPLIAVERCNLHGMWASEPKAIKVE